MPKSAILNLYESIRPVRTAEMGFANRMHGKKACRSMLLLKTAVAMIAVALLATITRPAAAQESILYSFGSGGYCNQGPTSAVVFDTAGNLYGTCNPGQVYELSAAGGNWTLTQIYTATGSGVGTGSSQSGLIFDANKINLYGVSYGGTYSDGAVFELSPSVGGGWTQTVLYSFQLDTDGANPEGGVTLDTAGNLYGSNYYGGAYNGGTIWEVAPGASGWTEKIIHSFETNGSDGSSPRSTLILDAKGNLYGTTYYGGNGAGAEAGYGTLFELTPQKDGTWTEQILYNFGATSTDAKAPIGNLLFDTNGNLYGVTQLGGANSVGAIYELSPTVGGGWTEKVLYSFGATSTDGASPRDGIVFDSQGNLYGTTIIGGLYNNNGTVYELSPAGEGTWTEKVLYNFDNNVNSDGYAPAGRLTLDGAGNIYGTTNQGGTHSSGTIFKFVSAPTAATPAFSPVAGSYATTQSVELSDTTPDAKIYYTTDETTPTAASNLYSGAITVSASETIEAIAVAAGYANSSVASATYTITQQAATPELSLQTGTYVGTQSVTITDSTSGATVYYTTNGTTPSTSSTKYSGAITVSATETIEAIAIASGYTNSNVTSATYTIQIPTAAFPVFTPAAGTYTSAQSVTITDSTSGATIYYTNDGTAPTTASTKYTGAITVSSTETIKAIAVASGYNNSGVAMATYTIQPIATGGPVSVLYELNSEQECPGFGLPSAPIFDTKGNLYGTCNGITGGGEIYELTPSVNTPWTGTVIYNNGLVLGNPNNALVFDSTKTNLYGTENSGGANGSGSVYELSPATGGSWTATTLYSFQHGTDGQAPEGGVIFDANGNLYGTTEIGGANNLGTVFELSPNGSSGWTEKILYSFGAYTGDGQRPEYGSLVFDKQGNLYGVTYSGGNTNSYGVVFELSPQTNGTWSETILHTFGPAGSSDGSHPTGTLVIDSAGNLYGVTESGGANGDGIVYQLSPGTGGTWTESILHTFNTNGTDGADPLAGLAMDSKGNLYGTTSQGGTNLHAGTIYELTPRTGGWSETILFSFAQSGDNIGYYPATSLTPDSSGNLYGVTTEGGPQGGGSVFEFTAATPVAATPTFSPAAGTYSSTQSVQITDTTPDAAIYYTTNGTTPTASSSKYTVAISVSATETIEAIAVASGYTNSAVASATYTIQIRTVATPTFSPVAGTYASAQSVTIGDSTSGATIYYTTNGTTPTTSSTKYIGAITVSATETIQAIAVATGYTNSAVTSATYTIQIPTVATPTFSPAAGTYTSAQSVTISDSNSGATIYYTTNGTAPTTASTQYTGAIAVSATETIEAIAVATGYANSAVASAVYTINVAAPGFSVTVSPSSLTIAPGQSATAMISVAPQNGFASPTTFSCSGLPSGASCSFSPATVTPSGTTAATSTLTISAPSSVSALRQNSKPLFPGGATLAIALCFIGFKKRRHMQFLLITTVVFLGASLLMIGCGGSSKPKPIASTVTVIATSGAIQQTVPISVTIQ